MVDVVVLRVADLQPGDYLPGMGLVDDKVYLDHEQVRVEFRPRWSTLDNSPVYLVPPPVMFWAGDEVRAIQDPLDRKGV